MNALDQRTTMSLPNFDDHAYAASVRDGSWLESDWRASAAFLSKKEHSQLISSIDDEHSPAFLKAATWGQILENNDLPKDNSKMRDDVHAWIGTYYKSTAKQMPVDVEVVESMEEEHDGPSDTLKQPKSVKAKRSRRKV